MEKKQMLEKREGGFKKEKKWGKENMLEKER